MVKYEKDDFDSNLEDIMKSIESLLEENGYESKEENNIKD